MVSKGLFEVFYKALGNFLTPTDLLKEILSSFIIALAMAESEEESGGCLSRIVLAV